MNYLMLLGLTRNVKSVLVGFLVKIESVEFSLLFLIELDCMIDDSRLLLYLLKRVVKRKKERH